MSRTRINKVTTRKGDHGQSSLATGQIVDKTENSIRSLGSLDELNSSIGLSICHVEDNRILKTLAEIQQSLFDLGAFVALEGEYDPPTEKDLEAETSELNKNLPALKEFVIPGGALDCAHLHQSRAVCRRAEIDFWALVKENKKIDKAAVYLNRLSDYLFVAARWVSSDSDQWRGPKSEAESPDISQ